MLSWTTSAKLVQALAHLSTHFTIEKVRHYSSEKDRKAGLALSLSSPKGYSLSIGDPQETRQSC